MDEEKGKLVVDFHKKNTAKGWFQAFEAFGLRGAPVWFEWLKWILIIGSFQYLLEKAKSLAVLPVLFISGIFLMLYFNGFFYNIEFKGIPFLKKFEHHRWPSVTLSALLAYAFCRLALYLAIIAAKHTS
jgi:hypothetical protein